MNFRILLFSVMVVAGPGSVSAQDFAKLVFTSLEKGKNAEALLYAEAGWRRQPSTHFSYLLAYTHFTLSDLDSAARYSSIALYDKKIHQDIVLNANQIKQLQMILKRYRKLMAARYRDFVNWLYYAYPGAVADRRRYELSDDNQVTKDLLAIAARMEVQRRLPTWQQYLDTLKKSGVADSTISDLKERKFTAEHPALFRDSEEMLGAELREQDGINGGGIAVAEIEWTDSSYKENSAYMSAGSGRHNPYRHSAFYDALRYPELFQEEEKEFIMFSMCTLYGYFMQHHQVDSTNLCVHRYRLDRHNLTAFYKKFFPAVIENKNDLARFRRQYEP